MSKSQMTKTEIAYELAELQIESMDYGDIVSLAFEQLKQNLAKMSKAELVAHYEHFGDTGDVGYLLELPNKTT